MLSIRMKTIQLGNLENKTVVNDEQSVSWWHEALTVCRQLETGLKVKSRGTSLIIVMISANYHRADDFCNDTS